MWVCVFKEVIRYEKYNRATTISAAIMELLDATIVNVTYSKFRKDCIRCHQKTLLSVNYLYAIIMLSSFRWPVFLGEYLVEKLTTWPQWSSMPPTSAERPGNALEWCFGDFIQESVEVLYFPTSPSYFLFSAFDLRPWNCLWFIQIGIVLVN
jgi:hypothetical protein